MSDFNRVGADDLLNMEEAPQQQEQQQRPLDGISFDPPQPQQPVQTPQPRAQGTRLQLLKNQRTQLMAKLNRNFTRGSQDGVYPDYLLDTDSNNQAYYGPKGDAAFRRDQNLVNQLQFEIEELQRQSDQTNAEADQVRNRARQVAEAVWNRLSPGVNKNLQQAVLEGYRRNLASVQDWGAMPELRDPQQLQALIELYFDDAHGKAMRSHRSQGRTGQGDEMDYSETDLPAGGQQQTGRQVTLKPGRPPISEGEDPIAYDIAQGIASRARQPSVLGGRRNE